MGAERQYGRAPLDERPQGIQIGLGIELDHGEIAGGRIGDDVIPGGGHDRAELGPEDQIPGVEVDPAGFSRRGR